MAMIEELTAEQEAKLDVYYEKWSKIGESTESLDEKEVAKALKYVYKDLLDMNVPTNIIYVDSPEAACKLIEEKAPNAKAYMHQYLACNLDIGWVAAHDFINRELLNEDEEKGDDLTKLFNKHTHMCQSLHIIFPFEHACIVVRRPTVLKTNERGLHSISGPALQYADGQSFYAINNTDVPAYIAETPGAKLDVKRVLAEVNVDVRREGLSKIPAKALIKALKPIVLDRKKDPKGPKQRDWVNYELLDCDFGDGKKRIILKGKYPGKKQFFFERVEDHCKTVNEALAWRDGETEYTEPSVLT